LVLPPIEAGSIWSARAAAFARCDLGGDHTPWHRLAASQLPEPRRGPDDYIEPAAADIPAPGADVDAGELIAAQLPQVLLMHDASHGSQVRPCCCELPRSNQDLGRVRTLTTTAWARAAADDHRGGEGWVVLAQSARLSTARRQWLFHETLG
jgi:hypothetical protein